MNDIQLLKAYGRLLSTPLSQIDSAEATEEEINLLQTRECGCPDYPDPEIAVAEVDDLVESLGLSPTECGNLIDAHRRMWAAATGRGSYPPNCNTDYPGVHAVAVYDDPKDWPSHLKRTLTDAEFQGIIDAKVWGPSGNYKDRPFTMSELKDMWGDKPLNEVVNDFSEETYRRWGVILYPVHTGPNGQHNIHVSYPTIAGSTIGIGWFPGADPCPGDHVNLHIDKTYTSGFQGQFGLKIHELGHTLQLPHQFTAQGSHQEPMSYSYRNHLVVGYSTGDPVFGLPRSPSTSLLTRLYGGEPVGKPWKGKFEDTTPTDPTDPIDTPPENPDRPKNDPNGVVSINGELWKIWLEKA